VLSNLRPVGGAGFQDDRRRTVYRANTEPDTVAADYPPTLVAVVDLRRDDEVDVVRHPLTDHAGYRNVPLFDPSKTESREGLDDGFEAHYIDWLDRHRETIAAVFRAVAAADGDVLVCCSAGKDRTGIVSALLARLWNASLDVVGADYAATADGLRDRFARELAASDDPERTAVYQRCDPEIIVHVVEYVERRWGSVAGYLRSIGLTDDEIDAL
jgi:protein-tyrosine phosphatase